MIGYDPALENMYPYDPAKAAELLKADGWTKTGEFWQKDGKRLAIKITAISTGAGISAARAGDPGLPAQVRHGCDGHAARRAGLARRQYQGRHVADAAAVSSAVDPDALHLWFLPDQYFNWSHYTEPGADQAAHRGPAGIRTRQANCDL